MNPCTNPCLKTGADVFIESHTAIAHGDLYLVGPIYLFVHTATPYWHYDPSNEQIDRCHAFFRNLGLAEKTMGWPVPIEHWFGSQRMIALHSDFVDYFKGKK